MAELPISHYGADDGFGDEGGTSLGKPYVGVEIAEPGASTFFEVGLRVPLASEEGEGLETGFLADHNRVEAFVPDWVSILLVPNYVYDSPSGFSVRLRLGPSLLVVTEKEEFSDRVELFGLYGAQLRYQARQVRVGAGFTGRLIVTEEEAHFEERSVHHVGGALIGDLGTVRPGLHLKVPVDEELGDGLDYVVGVSLSVPLR